MKNYQEKIFKNQHEIEKIKIILQLIEGINHIHQNNIIHRDLKPESKYI
jgi:serine/threonine protein kinase